MGVRMPTLINYSLSTFRDNSKPNKRRLQELQHSEARAHAARVAYWRKRKPGTRGRPKKTAQSDKGQISFDLDDVSGSGSTAEHEQQVENNRTSPEDLSTRSRFGIPDILGLAALGVPIALRTSPRASSSTGSSPDDKLIQEWGDLSSFNRLARHPNSRLFDPFDSVPSRQGDEVVTAVDHYLHSWAPSQRPGFKSQTQDNPLIRDIFPSALQNVELFEALVALCLGFRAAGSNFSSYLCSASLHHKCEALAGIRKKLMSGQVDEAVIVATVFLMIIDNVFLDVDAYKAHLAGLRKMFRASGSSTREAYSGSLKSFVSWAEANAMILFGEEDLEASPATLDLHYPDQPFPTSINKIILSLTPGFQAMAQEGHLSVYFLTVLENTIRWTRCIDSGSKHPMSEDDKEFLLHFDPRANSALVMELSRISSQQRHWERALSKALYIYHANVLNWSCRCTGYKRVVGELAEDLISATPQKDWELEFWSWMSLLIANAARRGSLPHLQSEAMAKFFSWNGRDEGWDEVERTLQNFLLHGRMSGELNLCWAAGINHIVL